MKTTYRVEGMTCGGCVRSLTNALQSAYARDVIVSLEAGTVTIDGLEEAALKKVIEDAGFEYGGPV